MLLKGESLSKQHRVLVADLSVKRGKQGKEHATPKIWWWKLKKESVKATYKEMVLVDGSPQCHTEQRVRVHSESVVRWMNQEQET